MARILIVEDEPDIRDLIAFTLRYGGHEVIPVGNGVDALAAAANELPDLALMDVRMPQMSGYEVCEKMKETPALAGIPVVFLSAKGQESEINEGLSAGAVDYMLKPFAPEALIERINLLLARFGRA